MASAKSGQMDTHMDGLTHGRMHGQTDGCTDGQTDAGYFIVPLWGFFEPAGDKKTRLHNMSMQSVLVRV